MVKKKPIPGSDRESWLKVQKAKEEIHKAIKKQKSYTEKLKNIKVKPVDSPLTRMKPVKRILTGTALDRILSRRGGIEAGSTVELYGVFAAGKTQVCEALVVEAEGLIIYIDAEHTFRADRLAEIARARGKDPEDINRRLLLYQPEDWIEQEAITLQLPEFDENDNFIEVGLIVVDSLMKHWASAPEFYGRENLTTRQQLVRAQLERLARYARRHNAVLVYTNQIYDKPVDTTFVPPEQKVGSRGGRTVEHIGDYRIFLRKGRGNIRFARLVDSPDLPLLEVPFILDESGIRDIPKPEERAKAIIMSGAYAEKFFSSQVGNKPAGKEYKIKALELGYITTEEARKLGLSEKEIQKALSAQAKTMDERLRELTTEELEVLEIEQAETEILEEPPKVKPVKPEKEPEKT